MEIDQSDFRLQCRISCGADQVVKSVWPYILPPDFVCSYVDDSNNDDDDDDSILYQMRGHAISSQLLGSRTVEDLLLQAESIHQFDGDWDAALELYKEILMMSYEEEHDSIATAPQWRQVWMGLCRCYYELGIYDKAISAGSAALEMNRHFPQVHKYIALAQKARGDPAAAMKTMKQAVLYEAPWCDATMQFNKDLLQQACGYQGR